jgi:MinD-like ATPase involved in chromosome partitioning or flagellar assembly
MPINLDQLTEYFHTRVRSVLVVPYDHHLAEGGEISLDLIGRKARQAYMNLAASIADTFGRRYH